MKKLLFITFLVLTLSTYAQEEFLKDSPGISLGLAHSNVPYDENINSFNFNAAVGYGLSLTVAASVYETELYPTIGASYIPYHKEKDTYITPRMSIAFSKADEFNSLGLSIGVMQCIHAQSSFPLSLRGNLSYHTTNYDGEVSSSTRTAAVGLGYNQAFFAKNDIYPILGFGTSVKLGRHENNQSSNIVYHFVLGLNMNLGD